MNTKIRLIEESDFTALAKVYVDVYTVFDVGEHWNEEAAEALLRYWCERQPDLAFVAEVDGLPVGGFIAGIKPWWDGNHLVDGELFVHPDFQGHGLGSRLSIHLFETAIAKYNVKSFDTYTFKKTDFPLEWYKSLGFQENSEWVLIHGDVQHALQNLQSGSSKVKSEQ